MDKKNIDKFFDSLSKKELKEKWSKYNKYSENKNLVTVEELVGVWNNYYDNTFTFHEPDIDISTHQNLILKESESYFGLFFRQIRNLIII